MVRARRLPMDRPAMAPLLSVDVDVDVEDGVAVGGGSAGEEDVAAAEGKEVLEGVDVVVVLVESVVDGGGEAVEPAVMRFRYESLTTVAVAPQYMMYWSSRALVMVTQAGAAEGLDHGC